MTAPEAPLPPASAGVPRIFHWWWDGPPPPNEYVRFREEWIRLHPDWEMRVWNERKWLAEFGRHDAAQFYTGRETFSPHAHEWGWKTNIARLVILHEYGGVWVDSDLEPLRSIIPLVGRLEGPTPEGNAMAAYEDRRYLNNAFLVSTRAGGFVTAAVEGLGDRILRNRGQTSMKATGPHYVTALATERTDIVALERSLIYPMHWSELERRGESFPLAYTVHHWHRKSEEKREREQREQDERERAAMEKPTPVPRRRKVVPLAGTTTGHSGRTHPSIRRAVPQGRSGPSFLRRQEARERTARLAPVPVQSGLPREIGVVKGLTSDCALIALAGMASRVPCEHAVVELGVYLGKSALALAWGARPGGAHVHAFDPWDLPGERFPWAELQDPAKPHRPAFTDPVTRETAERNVRTAGYEGRVTLHRDFSVHAGETWDGAPVGLLYVDGDHRYEAVHADLAAWRDHLAPDAMVVFDDYAPTHPEVVRAVDDLVRDGVIDTPRVLCDRLAVTGLRESVSTSKPSPATRPPQDAPADAFESMTVAELRRVAQGRGIVLGAGRRTREAILEALRRGSPR